MLGAQACSVTMRLLNFRKAQWVAKTSPFSPPSSPAHTCALDQRSKAWIQWFIAAITSATRNSSPSLFASLVVPPWTCSIKHCFRFYVSISAL